MLEARCFSPHGPDLPVPSQPDNVSDESESSSLQSDTEEMYFEPHQYDRPIDKFTQSELNDLIRELQLTEEKSKLLGSRLREKNMLVSGCCGLPGLTPQYPLQRHDTPWQCL